MLTWSPAGCPGSSEAGRTGSRRWNSSGRNAPIRRHLSSASRSRPCSRSSPRLITPGGYWRRWEAVTGPRLPSLQRRAEGRENDLARRSQSGAAFQLVERRWSSWRGRAVEPLARHALELAALSGRLPWPDAEAVGRWWNRQFSPEVDLVGADRAPVARRIVFAGSIKWLASPSDDHDLARLNTTAPQVPGFVLGESGLMIVSRSAPAPDLDLRRVDVVWCPADILGVWRS